MQESDVRKVAELMQRDWLSLLESEETGVVARPGAPVEIDPEGELPCPACGTAAPLVEGACTDCGLQLE